MDASEPEPEPARVLEATVVVRLQALVRRKQVLRKRARILELVFLMGGTHFGMTGLEQLQAEMAECRRVWEALTGHFVDDWPCPWLQ